jgi:hypothetical protein
VVTPTIRLKKDVLAVKVGEAARESMMGRMEDIRIKQSLSSRTMSTSTLLPLELSHPQLQWMMTTKMKMVT